MRSPYILKYELSVVVFKKWCLLELLNQEESVKATDQSIVDSFYVCSPGGNRTHTPLLGVDFESTASTIPPPGHIVYG